MTFHRSQQVAHNVFDKEASVDYESLFYVLFSLEPYTVARKDIQLVQDVNAPRRLEAEEKTTT